MPSQWGRLPSRSHLDPCPVCDPAFARTSRPCWHARSDRAIPAVGQQHQVTIARVTTRTRKNPYPESLQAWWDCMLQSTPRNVTIPDVAGNKQHLCAGFALLVSLDGRITPSMGQRLLHWFSKRRTSFVRATKEGVHFRQRRRLKRDAVLHMAHV